MEQSLEEEGRTGAASDRVKVIDWVLPLLIRRYNKTKPHTREDGVGGENRETRWVRSRAGLLQSARDFHLVFVTFWSPTIAR